MESCRVSRRNSTSTRERALIALLAAPRQKD